jgi:TPR repeat protein
LAQCYYNGIACAQNVVKALELLKEAGNSGNKNALALEKEIRLKYLSI